MSRIVLTPPDETIAADSMREAQELFALGYERAAAFMARFTLEDVTMQRLQAMEEHGTRRAYKDFINRRLARGCSLSSESRGRITPAYKKLCCYAHADGQPTVPVAELIDEAEACRLLVATATKHERGY